MATYWVSEKGNDTTGDGLSPATAYKTVAKAYSVLPATGSHFILCADYVRERFNPGRFETTSFNWQVIGLNGAVWDGQNTRTNAIKFEGRTAGTVKIRGFRFINHTSEAISWDAAPHGSTLFEVSDCYFGNPTRFHGQLSNIQYLRCDFSGACNLSSTALTGRIALVDSCRFDSTVNFNWASSVVANVLKNNYFNGAIRIYNCGNLVVAAPKFKNSTFGPSATIAFAATTTLGAATSITSDAQVNAKLLADTGVNYTLFQNNTHEKTLTFDSFRFSDSETNYLKFSQQGASRYTKSVLAANFVPNTEFTFTSDYITRNVTTDATAVFVATFPQARKIRRVWLQWQKPSATLGEGFTGANGSIPLSVEASLDGVNYAAPITLYSGIIDTGGGNYALDLPAALLAKTLRVSVTLTGGTSGLVRINGVSAEANAPEDYLVQGGRTLRQQLATGAGNLIPAPYSFRMPAPLRPNMLNPAKEYYTFAEITTEASGNPNVSIVAGPNANHIANVQVDNGSKVISVFTFKAS